MATCQSFQEFGTKDDGGQKCHIHSKFAVNVFIYFIFRYLGVFKTVLLTRCPIFKNFRMQV